MADTKTYNGVVEMDDAGKAAIQAVGNFFGAMCRDAGRACGAVADAANRGVELLGQGIVYTAQTGIEVIQDVGGGLSDVGAGVMAVGKGAWKTFTSGMADNKAEREQKRDARCNGIDVSGVAVSSQAVSGPEI